MRRLAGWLVCLSVIMCCVQPAWSGALAIDCAYLRMPERGDTATAYLFLDNCADSPIPIARLELDGQRIPIMNAPADVQADYERERAATAKASEANWGKLDRLAAAAESVWWSKVEPNPISAGGIGVVSIKRRSRPLRPFRIAVFGRGTKPVAKPSASFTVSTVLHPRGQALRIEAVGFEAAGEKRGGSSLGRLFLYVYVPGDGASELALADVWIDGRKATRSSAFLPLPIVPTPGDERQEGVGRRWLVACRLNPPVAPGQAVVVKTATRPSGGGQPEATAIRARAFSEFAVRTESGRQNPPGLFLDPVPVSDPEDGNADRRPNQCLLLECPTHRHGADYSRSAREIVEKAAAHRAQEPSTPCSIHLCRVKPIDGAGVFAELCDAVRVNAGVFPHVLRGRAPPCTGGSADEKAANGQSHAPDKAALPARHFSEFLVRAMREAAGAGTTVQAVIPAGRHGKGNRECVVPEQLRLCVFGALSGGARGILYRTPAWSDRESALREAASELNQELQALKPLLRLAAPVPLVRVPGGQAQAASLLAGDRAIVILVLNREGFPVRGDLGKFDAEAVRSADVELALPTWFRPGPAYQVSGAKRLPVPVSREKGWLRLRVDDLRTVKAFVIPRARP